VGKNLLQLGNERSSSIIKRLCVDKGGAVKYARDRPV
jgi:hypothetical protein